MRASAHRATRKAGPAGLALVLAVTAAAARGQGSMADRDFYPMNTRNHRLSLQLIDVNHSPVSSTFGHCTGGQDGTTVAAVLSVFF